MLLRGGRPGDALKLGSRSRGPVSGAGSARPELHVFAHRNLYLWHSGQVWPVSGMHVRAERCARGARQLAITATTQGQPVA